jgi:hypothetical protein
MFAGKPLTGSFAAKQATIFRSAFFVRQLANLA